jgi:hypothetical protein
MWREKIILLLWREKRYGGKRYGRKDMAGKDFDRKDMAGQDTTSGKRLGSTDR